MRTKEWILENCVKNVKLRVWWSNNFGQKFFTVNSVEEAMNLINDKANQEVNDPKIIWNASGLEEFEDGEWTEWYNEDGLDITDLMDA